MQVKMSYVLAAMIAGGVGFWMWSGTVVVGGRADAENATPPPAQRQESQMAAAFRVSVRDMVAVDRTSTLEIRGITEAEAKVTVRAETNGRMLERPAREGARIAAGDVMCVLDSGSREARVLEAKAQLAQAKVDFDAASQLSTKGFAAENRVAALRAALDAASARLEEAEIELDRTVIRAPVSGIVESPMAKVGDHLAIGAACGTIVDADPMIAIGQVSELNVGLIRAGMAAQVELITGQSASGTVRYVAPAADPNTRTFRVEIEIPNADGQAKDGTTAVTRLPLQATKAHKVSPAILTLDDAGRVGVRTVDASNKARFMPVTVLGGEADGVWIGGLPDTARVIVVGQDYVSDGQLVEPVVEVAEAAQ
ncbi:efflux RND transporter periplasmic adaptor subunit [Microvirga tunisiensis]|uniref:Efflux RND transporter periplasmic adaptor subunit n=1 Tax=Pannonibacter tanglangensis TaxID=2750084 RepID=A0A7X5F1Z4_9HYPH|nr:efflux RND transporter periplasmic adaptor subunit [Pannonibacter sp. XCT-53]NBN78292.1 efflux RND transporter periplasmic adaptor subunit [Pannonibacter sp. XCT-53]